ncbi:MAG: hypothetical protein FJ276_35705, partial [Planctomycetes bacterium]|nr:hypothetical protein [Planctomycetota bacterium]
MSLASHFPIKETAGRMMLWLVLFAPHHAIRAVADEPSSAEFDTARRLRDYFEQMSVAKPFLVRDGQQWESHCRALRDYVLDCAG